jgi:hypothetical protein
LTDNGQHPAPPEPAERGRYAVYEQPDGGIVIARAVNLCERCLDCGCGEQADPIGPVPGTVIQMARAAAEGKLKLSGAVKQAMRRGR